MVVLPSIALLTLSSLAFENYKKRGKYILVILFARSCSMREITSIISCRLHTWPDWASLLLSLSPPVTLTSCPSCLPSLSSPVPLASCPSRLLSLCSLLIDEINLGLKRVSGLLKCSFIVESFSFLGTSFNLKKRPLFTESFISGHKDIVLSYDLFSIVVWGLKIIQSCAQNLWRAFYLGASWLGFLCLCVQGRQSCHPFGS